MYIIEKHTSNSPRLLVCSRPGTLSARFLRIPLAMTSTTSRFVPHLRTAFPFDPHHTPNPAFAPCCPFPRADPSVYTTRRYGWLFEKLYPSLTRAFSFEGNSSMSAKSEGDDSRFFEEYCCFDELGDGPYGFEGERNLWADASSLNFL